MTTKPTEILSRAGVSLWLDDLSRTRLDSGDLAGLVAERNVVGVTTNPSIFAGALRDGASYAPSLGAARAAGMSAAEAVIAVTAADVRDACDVFAPVFAASEGRDGRVSLEVSPALAHDAEATVAQALELWRIVDRPNAMIKIPATDAGLEAIAAVLAEGISVNVTLIFSISRFRQVHNAVLGGLERARLAGRDLAAIRAVASVFVSRLDTAVDARLRAIGSPEALARTGTAGVANARLCFAAAAEAADSERAAMLADSGAHPLRPLWASTGVKDPALPPTHYVTELCGPGVVNTLPAATLAAVAESDQDGADRLTGTAAAANAELNAIDALGIDLGEITAELERAGLASFLADWQGLEATVAAALEETA